MSGTSPIDQELRGARRWDELRELAASDGVRAWIEREFPSQLPRLATEVGRRDFLQLMGASMALAGLGSCTRQPEERILPFASAPERRIPGRPQHYATAMPLGTSALGLVVESHEGRPTKVEGNPEHPTSLGATGAIAQAATLSLYDPDRSQVVLRAGEIATWDAFVQSLQEVLGAAGETGEGVRVLTPTVLSPSLAAQLRAYLASRPGARWHQYEPLHPDHAHEGALLAFGRPVAVRHRFERARVVLSLDADFLAEGHESVRYARDFMERRRVRGDRLEMNRLYVVESAHTPTGAFADHRLALRPSEVERFARQLARAFGLEVDAGPAPEADRLRFVEALARDLREAGPEAALIVGDAQPPAVHAIAHVLRRALGCVGTTAIHSDPVEAEPANHVESLRELVAEMRAGDVRALFVLGGNPVYDAPGDLEFADALRAVPYRAHLSLHEDETSRLCHWHVNEAHFLESWGDTRAHDGTVSVVQPLIAPLYGGHTALEIVAALDGRSGVGAYELVREHWRAERAGESEADFERAWRRSLHDGWMAGTELPAIEIEPRTELALGSAPTETRELELRFQPDACVWDGRFANNGWLQEQPRPLTRLTWDNAFLISPATAARLGIAADQGLGLARNEIVEVRVGGRAVRGAAWIAPGQPDDTVGAILGYGRRAGGGIAEGVGFDVYPLRPSSGTGWVRGVELVTTGARYPLASVQDHRRMEGRDLVRHGRVGDFDGLSHHTGEHSVEEMAGHSLLEQRTYEPHSWGMVIDLNACTGCNACMVGCQAENNVPIVGKAEVSNGREMHWLRVDVYHEGSEEAPTVLHQPVPCMHCETAPCELVCPVGATVHGPEGLNEMVYNRCVGTRYCSNNCPYKVRRFNFYDYSRTTEPVVELGRNPDVTVRSRGVMEKCTYCVQRIQAAKIQGKLEERPLSDGDVVPACQQACPTQAIVFGDMNDPDSRVSRLRREPHHYGLLAELGTRPHTTYLARFRNPNPELESS